MTATIAQEITDWFQADVLPRREGLYQTRPPGRGIMTWSVWKNGCWHYAAPNADESVRKARAGCLSYLQIREWRGLRSPAC